MCFHNEKGIGKVQIFLGIVLRPVELVQCERETKEANRRLIHVISTQGRPRHGYDFSSSLK